MSNIISKINLNGTDNFIASSAYGVCTTAATQINKIVSLQNGSNFNLINGVTVHIKFDNNNTTGNPTLNINSTGAKNILNPGGNGDIQWPANTVLSLTYYDNNYYINGFFKEGTGGGEGGGNISPATNVYNVSTTSSSIGSVNRYAKEDHIHQLSVAEGNQNGYVQIGNSQVKVKGIAAAAFRDSADIINVSNQDKVPTVNAVINYVTGQIPQVPVLSTNIQNDRTSNTKTTTPKAVVDYVDQAISGLTPGGGGSGDIQLTNDITTSPNNRTTATTPYAISHYIQDIISNDIQSDSDSEVKLVTPSAVVQYVEDALEDISPGGGSITIPPAFARIGSNGTEAQINATLNSGGDLFNINPGTHTSVTLTPDTRTIEIGSTLSSQEAVQNGTALSLVTTGEKYLWNNVSQATGGINFALRESPSYVLDPNDPNIFPPLVNDLVLLTDNAEGPDGLNYYYSGYSNGDLSFGDPDFDPNN